MHGNTPPREIGTEVSRLAGLAGSRVADFYAAIARLLIGGAEDMLDMQASRRSQRIDLGAAKQAARGRQSDPG